MFNHEELHICQKSCSQTPSNQFNVLNPPSRKARTQNQLDPIKWRRCHFSMHWYMHIQFRYIINRHGLGEVTHRLWPNPTQPNHRWTRTISDQLWSHCQQFCFSLRNVLLPVVPLRRGRLLTLVITHIQGHLIPTAVELWLRHQLVALPMTPFSQRQRRNSPMFFHHPTPSVCGLATYDGPRYCARGARIPLVACRLRYYAQMLSGDTTINDLGHISRSWDRFPERRTMGCEIPLILTNEQNSTFYSLRLFVSTITVFTVRRSALHGICDSNFVRLSVCPSVCLSVTLVDYVHMVRPTIMISSLYGSPII